MCFIPCANSCGHLTYIYARLLRYPQTGLNLWQHIHNVIHFWITETDSCIIFLELHIHFAIGIEHTFFVPSILVPANLRGKQKYFISQRCSALLHNVFFKFSLTVKVLSVNNCKRKNAAKKQ